MTQNDILTLARAGFTAQQIAALSVTQAPATPAASAASAASAAPAPLTYEQFQQELQKIALMGAQQSGKPETADTILASIINPPRTGIEEGK